MAVPDHFQIKRIPNHFEHIVFQHFGKLHVIKKNNFMDMKDGHNLMESFYNVKALEYYRRLAI